jgi:hypothetical protein
MSDAIVVENARAGTARKDWDLPAGQFGGHPDLQGFVDGFSVARTGTATFKIGQVGGRGWRMEIYRLGWYRGLGARHVATVQPTAAQMAVARSQPAPGNCDPDVEKPSADCAGWRPVLSWRPPRDAPGGVYVAKLVRTDGAASHVLFVVRDDRRAEVRVMLADMTWQAYNAWGGLGDRMFAGNSLYFGTNVNQADPGSAKVVSYDRPVINRAACDPDRGYGAVKWSNFWTNEYPMVRWLERYGYGVAYMAGLDAAGSRPVNARVGVIVGHNEYFNQQMKNVWLAHLAGGNGLLDCAGNEAFWRTVGQRLDGSRRPRLVRCHKEIIPGRVSPPEGWTGTWRAVAEPENAWLGTIFALNGPTFHAVEVPAPFHEHRVWRGTGIRAGWRSPGQVIGFEADTYGPEGVSTDAGRWMAVPGPGVSYASDTVVSSGWNVLLDAGQAYGAGTVRHRLVYVERSNGGVTFATGTPGWVFGLDNANVATSAGGDNTSAVIQRATVNVLADMGTFPAG